MTSLCIRRRMSGHVRSSMLWTRLKNPATTLLALLLLLVAQSSKTASSKSQPCGGFLQQTLRLTRLIQKESVELIKTYKASQGEMSHLFCKMSIPNVPEPNISGLEPSERMESIHRNLQAFSPHLRRVYEQQTDLQPPDSLLLVQLGIVGTYSRNLEALMQAFYRKAFPNLQDWPAGAPTSLPPPQNIFQQKVYGCVVLKTYKEFLLNVSRELRTIKGKVCRGRRNLL
ncbi:IL-6 subfamily cytokine M17 [Dunckerocampus dactyliophorus]|uniref:IL-6 subfamily cytokine M17 n=1 Tax=Dunckerocampus dactyliophorus TaxID=161453 RepID=UPI002404DDE3|nr:IL-6 subfamily cytokine M17 [Dunckerocampus dactyliophorus]XP_054613396.1 IL-6 subfamily cytokine M17 [Dunckerocampus dactyliophorus]